MSTYYRPDYQQNAPFLIRYGNLIMTFLFGLFSFFFVAVYHQSVFEVLSTESVFRLNSSSFLSLVSKPGGGSIYIGNVASYLLDNALLAGLFITLLLIGIQQVTYYTFQFTPKQAIWSYLPSFFCLIVAVNFESSSYLSALGGLMALLISLLLLLLLLYWYIQLEKQASRVLFLFVVILSLSFMLSGGVALLFCLLLSVVSFSQRGGLQQVGLLIYALLLFGLWAFVMYEWGYVGASWVDVCWGIHSVLSLPKYQTANLGLLFILVYYAGMIVTQRFLEMNNQVESVFRWAYSVLFIFLLLCCGVVCFSPL